MWLSVATAYKQFGSLAIITVMLWLGGFGCSLCCATGATDSCCLKDHQSSARATASGLGAASCDAGAACRCCKSQRAEGQTALVVTGIGREGALGCSLLPNRIEAAITQMRIADALATPGELPTPLFTPYSPTHTTSLLEAPTPLNRGGTYLRCCVLLI